MLQWNERSIPEGPAAEPLQSCFSIQQAPLQKRKQLKREFFWLEKEILKELYEEKLAYFQANAQSAVEYLSVGQMDRNDQINEEAHAALAVVVNTIFNLDETKFN